MDHLKIISELQYKAVRSSGAGGQNVNKVSSKVVLSFDLRKSQALSDDEKMLLEQNISNRLTTDLVLLLNCDEDRSQLKNKELVVTKRFYKLSKQLEVPKDRKPTKVPKVIRSELKTKKHLPSEAEKKPNLD
jgi:ribosome-associated protein